MPGIGIGPTWLIRSRDAQKPTTTRTPARRATRRWSGEDVFDRRTQFAPSTASASPTRPIVATASSDSGGAIQFVTWLSTGCVGDGMKYDQSFIAYVWRSADDRLYVAAMTPRLFHQTNSAGTRHKIAT